MSSELQYMELILQELKDLNKIMTAQNAEITKFREIIEEIKENTYRMRRLLACG